MESKANGITGKWNHRQMESQANGITGKRNHRQAESQANGIKENCIYILKHSGGVGKLFSNALSTAY